MASEEEQLDIAERNILYLKELKSLISAKNQLLSLKLLSIEPKHFTDKSIEKDCKHLIASVSKQTNLDNTGFNLLLNSFITENIIENRSGEPKLEEFKQKFHEHLQQLKKSTNSLQELLEKLRKLTIKNEELNDEILLLRNKHDIIIEQNIETAEQNKKEKIGSSNERNKQILSRVEKINVMRTIINGLIYNTGGVNWEEDPILHEIAMMCRSVYKLE